MSVFAGSVCRAWFVNQIAAVYILVLFCSWYGWNHDVPPRVQLRRSISVVVYLKWV